MIAGKISVSTNAENRSEDFRSTRHRVTAYAPLFVSHQQKQAVEGFLRHVLIYINGVSARKIGQRAGLFHQAFELSRDAYLFGEFSDDRQKLFGQTLLAGSAEKLCGGIVLPFDDSARVIKGHLLDGILEHLYCRRHSAFGGVIHSRYEIVCDSALPYESHSLFDGLQSFRHGNPNAQVFQETAVAA
jgi:hypothetical protein